MISSNRASSQRKTVYEIGPPSWIRKHVNTNTLQKQLALPISFCDAIGLQETCTITLKTSMNSIGSWLVHGHPYENNSYKFARGWRRFCKDNCLGEGDICTFHVVKTTLWHVVITRYHEKINHLCNLESPFVSSRKYKSKNDWRSSEGQKTRKGSMTLNKASLQKKCVFEIGPPSWIKKMTNTNTLENTLMKGRR